MNQSIKTNQAVIGVGSNVDPERHIQMARIAVEKAHRLVRSSGFVQTEPVGYKEQPPFTNGAWLIETRMMLSELTEWLHILEDRLGRVRTENRFGPRTIDLDVLVWNGEIVDEDVFERDFLNKAVLEVLPGIAEQM